MTTTERLQERRNRPWSDVEELVAGEETQGEETRGEASEPAGSTVRQAVVDTRTTSQASGRRVRLLVTLMLVFAVSLIIIALIVRARSRVSPTDQLLDRSQRALETLIP